MDILSMNPGFIPRTQPLVPAARRTRSETTWQDPACIFVPRTVDELQGAVTILVEEDARFGVRSGGYSPNPGAAVVDGSVLIDLSRFTQIEYNAEHEKVVIGTGLRWRNVYDYLDPYGVTVVGGKHLDVGVGGLILGFWGGTRLIAWDRLDDVLDAMLEYETSTSTSHSPEVKRDESASINIDIAATNETITLTLLYLKPVEGEKTPPALSVFDRFEGSTIMDTTGIKTLTELMSEFPAPPIPRSCELILLHPISPDLVKSGQRSCGGVGNALGLEASWFRIDLRWWHAADDEAMRAAGVALYAKIEAAAKEEGSHLPYIFMNDANEGQPVIASYGEDNVQRMGEVREHYDPHRVFDKLLAGAFKLP
ncbi:Bifunctional solanapyrone synthase [Apiospora rasikravindrae]|uniref:Bifunctional solanapyrone synthase n=1 Tax=Apiospora rasikravindrae TaxID=990691 RepID=A0ABR1TG36_9PEZI